MKKNTATEYLNWQNKVIEQNLNASHFVIYTKSAKDANATIVRREDIDFEFILDYSEYVCYTQSVTESYYLTAILNSNLLNARMKDFQARGLFGARHVAKKILDIYYPRFDAGDETHRTLARLSETAHEKASAYLAANPPNNDLTPMRLGRLRLDIKRHLTDEMREIDGLVEKLIG